MKTTTGHCDRHQRPVVATPVHAASLGDRRSAIQELNARLRECRRCHQAGHLTDVRAVPIARDPEPDAPVPRILLIGQAPGLRANNEDVPFAGAAGEKLRDWFECAGIARDDFWRKIHFSAITRCYPGRLPGARGDRVPSPVEQALCRPWLDEQLKILEPRIVLLVGLLAIRTFLGRVTSLTGVVGTATIRDGIHYLPLPHPSGVSRWLNAPENVASVAQAMEILRGWIEALDMPCDGAQSRAMSPASLHSSAPRAARTASRRGNRSQG